MSVSSSEARTENMIIPRHPALPPSGRTSTLRPILTTGAYTQVVPGCKLRRTPKRVLRTTRTMTHDRLLPGDAARLLANADRASLRGVC